jgi:DNA-directed RNA polymerase sigma subunit (sigma70/sigma32)
MEKVKKRKRNDVVIEKEKISKIIEESDGDLTLQEIGEIYNITRMRVCQIEKSTLKKLANIDSLKELL